MRSPGRVAVVGAGFAGLASAKVLTEAGFAVEIFDSAPDVGGVWSQTRRYPGLRAQTSKDIYCFSDWPMPAEYPAHPDGRQMQGYLAGYVERFGLTDELRLRTEVGAADPVDGGWLLEIHDDTGSHRISCDHLVVATGVHSSPELPDLPGRSAFTRGGGQVGHSSQLLDLNAVRGRSVLVVGFGASGCEIACEISRVAASTTVLARRAQWKIPRKIGWGLDAERVLLTRTGEAHFRHPDPGWFGRWLHGPGRSFQESNVGVLQTRSSRRTGAVECDAVPQQPFEQVGGAGLAIVEGEFAERVRAGRIGLRNHTTITRLAAGPRGPFAYLSDGTQVAADIVVCATGFRQHVPFLTPYVQRQLTDDNGDFRLYRGILPLEVPHLTFAGYNSSLLGVPAAELGAHWTAALLTGDLSLPPAAQMRAEIDGRLRLVRDITGGRHAHGGSVAPFAIRYLDDVLADLGVELPFWTRAQQWWRPVRPADYRVVAGRRRTQRASVAPPPAPVSPA